MQTIIRVGSSFEEAAGEFIKVWRQVERGEDVEPHVFLGFATWEQLCGVLSRERFAVLQHLGGQSSAAALAQSLGWELEEVSHHLEVLVGAGLIERHGEQYRRIADDFTVRISLKS